MRCENCGTEQDVGRFCGKCGTPLTETNLENAQSSSNDQITSEKQQTAESTYDEQAAVIEKKEASNEAVDKVKHTTKMYGAYFVEYLKQPSLIFSKREEEFKYGLINMAIVSLLIALASYMLVRNFTLAAFGQYSGGMFADSYASGPSLFPVFGYVLLFTIISIAIVVFLLYVTNHLFGTACSFKKMANIYGTHLVPVILFTCVTFILILLKANTFGGYMLLISLGLVLTTLPIYLLSSLLTRKSKNIDPVYAYLVYLVATGIAFSIFVFIMMDSTFGRILDQIGYY